VITLLGFFAILIGVLIYFVVLNPWDATEPAHPQTASQIPLSESVTQYIAAKTGDTAQPATHRGVFTDSRDGRHYPTVRIGNVTWMAENLNFTTSGSWCYDNDTYNCTAYGRLYTWQTAMTACPPGWRLPDNADWENLVRAAGGSIAGQKLKSTVGWSNNGNGTDEFGFSALPGGNRDFRGSFNLIDTGGYWWSASEDGARSAMGWDLNEVRVGGVNRDFGFSVRCVRRD
jgi:uncharacterized protein (TIGR02145 family)